MKQIKWGVIGCGGIANIFAQSLNVLPEGTLIAGASQTPGKAEAFAKTYGLDRAYSDYNALLADTEIEAIYVATTHNFHYDNVKRCLQHGKHVLCEKPFTLNAKQAEELMNLAKENKCFLMEAMWTRFLPAIIKLKELLAEGIIGDVHTVRADFCVGGANFDEKHRMRNKALAGGAILDLGVYPIAFADIIFNCAPERMQSSVRMDSTEVDGSSFYQLDYPGNRTAQLSSSYLHRAPNDAIVMGTKGFIRVPEFWQTQALEIHRNEQPPETLNFPYGPGENFKYEIAHAMQCIQAGQLESDVNPHAKTISILKTMDALRAQWNLTYPNE